MEIRRATKHDLDAIDRLLTDTLWQEDQSVFGHLPFETQQRLRKALRRTTRDPAAGVLIVLDDTTVVGMLAVHTTEIDELPLRTTWRVVRLAGLIAALHFMVQALRRYRPRRHEAYLFGLAVAPSHRRRGLAERLMVAGENYARQLGKPTAVGFIAHDNAASMAVSTNRGWTFDRPRPGTRYVRVTKSLG